MSNFTTYFNNLKKIAKNINVDYIKKIYKYTYVVGSCIELKPIFFKAFAIIRGISSFN